MKYQQPPLKIDCEGLSQKLIAELADRLSMHFFYVKAWSDEIEVAKPLDNYHYNAAWKIIDRFGVKCV